MRAVHRILAVFAVAFGLYIATTGVLTQLTDLQAVLNHAPASNPTMQAIRNGIYGPPNYQVIRDADFSAPALPAEFDYNRALKTVAREARASLGDQPISFIELRVADGIVVGKVGSRRKILTFNASTGALIGAPLLTGDLPTSVATPGLRNELKALHRFGGNWANLIMAAFGVTLLTMIFTGSVVYLRLLAARRRMGKLAPFWSAGGVWRAFHRSVAAVAAIFLTIVALSGTVLAISGLGVAVSRVLHDGKRPGMTGDFSFPLTDAELPAMLKTTLSSYGAAHPHAPIRVLRLRYFAGMPQGVVVTGDDEAEQWVFNTRTGRRASMTEPGYPNTDVTFGWQVDETVKKIHRGDFFGLTGRIMDLLTGLSLLYLCISSVVMYLDMWGKRRAKGRRGLFWPDPQNAPAAALKPKKAETSVTAVVSPGEAQ
jgi:uncharacterized iron-regulated membrane protein